MYEYSIFKKKLKKLFFSNFANFFPVIVTKFQNFPLPNAILISKSKEKPLKISHKLYNSNQTKSAPRWPYRTLIGVSHGQQMVNNAFYNILHNTYSESTPDHWPHPANACLPAMVCRLITRKKKLLPPCLASKKISHILAESSRTQCLPVHYAITLKFYLSKVSNITCH